MEVAYASAHIRDLLFDERALKRTHGARNLKKLRVRITSIRNAATLAELHNLPGRTHQLKGARSHQFALDLDGGFRLIITPTHPVPAAADGGIDLHAVTRVTIVEISKHYT